MKQLLIQRVADTYLTVDITGVGRRARTLPSKQHKSWQETEEYLLSEGAPRAQVTQIGKNLQKSVNAILTF
jgi:hypothetical protein